ncbi:MAG TPA: tyrosine-protein phosphatase [Tepidisphaeraceae bacterium]|jgi:protein tyrosine/serine phosphatase
MDSRGPAPSGRPAIYRGDQPNTLEDLKKLQAEKGVVTLIDLRDHLIPPMIDDPRRMRETSEWAQQLGMTYVNIPSTPNGSGRQEIVDHADQFMQDVQSGKLKGPFFVFCTKGRDRTGLFIARLRMTQDGWSPDDAAEEMMEFGQNRVWAPGMDRFVRNMSPPTPALSSGH